MRPSRRAFGTPKPTLANSYRPELLNLRTFPTLMGYSSRILAESWESNTLYWAALADETEPAAGATQRAHSGMDREAGGAYFRLASGGLAGGAALAARRWATMCATKPASRRRPSPGRRNLLTRVTTGGLDASDFAARIFRSYRGRRPCCARRMRSARCSA